jgi:uncharacterized protein (DUF2141 family)
MFKAVFLAFFLCSGFLSYSQGHIIANITNFENNKGVCKVCIFNSADAYAKKQPLQCISVPVSNRKAEAAFPNVPVGTYAVFVFHDANNNGKMDTNFLGIPSEGYGASQNKLPFAAAPKFNANKFNLSNETSVTVNIRLRNL